MSNTVKYSNTITRRQFLSLSALGESAPQPATPPSSDVREYWIQADSMVWNLVPNGRDDMTGAAYTPLQTTYQPSVYRAYTPDWKETLPASGDIGMNDGIPGPIIRGRAGDKIVIHFRNNDFRHRSAHSIHAHGLRYDPGSDGLWAMSTPDAPGTAVQPGETCVYRFIVPRNAAGCWLYYDASMPELYLSKPFRPMHYLSQYMPAQPGDADEAYKYLAAQLGLFGMIVIEDPLAPAVDHENIVLFHDIYADDIFTLPQDFDCINGRCFIGNTPTFHARVGERVRWRIGSLGKENHVFHIHGHRWLSRGKFTDTLILGPASTGTSEYIEDSPGTWLYHCHVVEHMMRGMAGLYVVTE